MAFFQFIGRLFSFMWRMLDAGRRAVFNLLFLAIILVILLVIFSENKPLGEKTALILNIRGDVVEQDTLGARQLLMLEAQGEKRFATQLRDVINVIDAAARDPKIASIVLLPDEMEDAGLPVLREIRAALERFKAANKKVVAWGSRFNQKQYFLVANADEIYMHPMGLVAIEGLGGYRNYYRDALDKLGITVNAMRVGTFKSFVEPFIANGPSQSALEAERFLYDDLWATYVDDVEHARKLERGSIMRMINGLPDELTHLKGDWALIAQNYKLVDGLKTRDELRLLMLERGVTDDELKSFRQISFDEYLARLPAEVNAQHGEIGVIIAEGEISDGITPPGVIGGVSTSNLIREAREDDHIKAVVVRVNSPGGSAFASELIRREIEVTRAVGKPVIVSMGNVAASGGYWMSMSADEVIADPATVTGSIGVFALLPTADKAMGKIGIHSGGTTTAWLRGGYDITRPLDARFGELIQQSINHIYAEFIRKAAHARHLSPTKIEAVAEGRVWTGRQAKERGLVDTLGGFEDAINAAAAKANVTKPYAIQYIEAEPHGLDRFLKFFDVSSLTNALARQWFANISPIPLPYRVANDALKEVRWVTDLTDGQQAYSVVAHCFCDVGVR